MTYIIDTTTWRSPNYGARPGGITSIVVHSCEGRAPEPRKTSLPWLCNPASRVSCHYYVCRDTTIYQLVDDAHEAWHAGVCQWQYDNDVSLGIECEHRSGMDWPVAQKDALAWLLQTLTARYSIGKALVDTHGQIAIKGPYIRKSDPTNWPHQAFIGWRDAVLAPAPITKAYRGRRIMISQPSTGGPPYAGEIAPGEEVIVDKWYTTGMVHLQDGRGFVLLSDLEPV
jgi:N-acetylmuramoyl-L-alanine amidase